MWQRHARCGYNTAAEERGAPCEEGLAPESGAPSLFSHPIKYKRETMFQGDAGKGGGSCLFTGSAQLLGITAGAE